MDRPAVNPSKPCWQETLVARIKWTRHHPCHRPVWAEHAENTKTFPGQLGRAQKAERARLQAEYDRAARVLARIDETAAAGEPG